MTSEILIKYEWSNEFNDLLSGVTAVDLESLAYHRYGLNPARGLWSLSCEEVIQLAYGTSLVLHNFLLVPERMHRGAPEVFPHQ